MAAHSRIVLLAVLTIAGCKNPSRLPTEKPSTLADNPAAPHRVLASVYGASWQNIAKLRYDAFMVFSGSIEPDGHLGHPRLETASPDRKRLSIALGLIEHVVLPANSVGSRTRPRAEVQIYFYETDQAKPEAFVVAWRKSSVGFTDFNGRATFTGFFNYEGPNPPH